MEDVSDLGEEGAVLLEGKVRQDALEVRPRRCGVGTLRFAARKLRRTQRAEVVLVTCAREEQRL